MAKPAKRHWEDREHLVASLGSNGLWGHVCWFVGIVFAVVGVIGDAVNRTPGLEPTTWLLLAIFTFLVGFTFFFGMGLAWYLSTK